ncbi:SLAIN motif-containing protein 1-like [Limanda limanda]|uniref:SLAIN motif-containing protein 1-like n=1 Tax=Limanda limanda TaxID=27771 RepID=UPI0029C949AE|nr:SLAIN motif-containing protein 1-like [Limanda limanda]
MEVMEELDLNSNRLPPELEVKKLQQLVRRLELQNEQLRASGCPGGLAPGFGLGGPGAIRLLAPPRCLSPPVEPFEYFQPHGAGDGASEPGEDEAEPSVLDGLELLDLEVLCCHEEEEEEEETWLYESQKAVALGVDSLTPLQWSRHVLDRPKTEVEAARRSLSLRLEQVSRWRSSLSSPSHSSPGPPLSRVAGVSPIRAPPCSTPLSSDRHGNHASLTPENITPSLSSSLHHVLHRTFSPVGKEFSPPLADRTPTFLPHLENSSKTQLLRRSVLSPQSSVDSDLLTSEDESLTLHGYKLHDLTDVQVMARLQEESLRQDYASTSSTLANRRSQSFTFQLSAGRDLEEDDEEEDDEDYGLLPPPQARLTRLPHSHTFSSMRDWRRSTTSLCTPPTTPTTPSTPPLPSAGFAFQPLARLQLPGPGPGAEPPGFRSGSGEFENKLRRSMPNLVRAPSMPSVPVASPCLLRNSLSFDSSSGLARLQSSIPSPGQLHHRVQSVGNFLSLSRQPLKATAYVSPTIKGPAPPSLQPPSSSGGGNSGIPLFSKSAGGATPTSTSRSSLPRPASCVGATSSTPRSKVALPARSLLMPPKSLSTLSALRDGAWRDGCY